VKHAEDVTAVCDWLLGTPRKFNSPPLGPLVFQRQSDITDRTEKRGATKTKVRKFTRL